MSHTLKVVNLILYDGTLDGEIYIEDKNWTHSGELYSYPRASAKTPIDNGISQKFGVYLLLSSKKVYVGQSRDLSQRINQHLKGKDWWEKAVILTAKNDFTKTDIDYLEYVLIEKAFKNGTLDCDNKRKEKEPKINKPDKMILEQYLEEALLLLQLLGITVFDGEDKKTRPKSPKAKTLVPTTVHSEKELSAALYEGERKKDEAIEFLSLHGIHIDSNNTYAKKQPNREECWANPVLACLNQDWNIILNDNQKRKLIVLTIPGKTLKIKDSSGKGLCTRDNGKIDLRIDISSLIDKKSGIDFSPFVSDQLSY